MRRIVGLLATTAVLAGCAGEFQRTVPKEYRKSIRAAAKECPELTPKLLAAQIDQESGFDPDAVSPAGAEGIAQFIPDTWAVWGRDLDGDGVASPYNPEEAIDAQARLMCFLIFEARTSGIKGDEIELALAGYNAGWSQVVRYDGIPPFRETKAYVKRIRDRQSGYRFRD
ncbi:MAG: lytic transglycosylase domain-containing protein [Candidatus Nanopelagicales bacterium]|nr:lytic transglycosylase domain-containing protein [Candidatus Nanopelagicales bacterium]HPJ19060.1 lytic transglycosylase domain-containing protein [Actinomycetota bacterium]